MRSPSRKERMGLLHTAVDSGITHFDTARMYGLGMAEKELGHFLRSVDRGSVTIATKFGIEPAGNARLIGRIQRPARSLLRRVPAIRAAVRQRGTVFSTPRSYRAADAARSLEQSLRALNTDYVDLFFLHAPREIDHIDIDGLIEFFEGAKQQGKIRAWGVSQDEDTDVDLAARLGTPGVRQLRCSAVSPPHRPVDLAFGIFYEPYSVIRRKLYSDTELLDQWRQTLGLDPLVPGVLTDLILASSREALNATALLYSTTQQHRLAEASASMSTTGDSATLTRFADLARRLGKEIGRE